MRTIRLIIVMEVLFWAFNVNAQVDRQIAQPVLMALPTGIDGNDPLTTFKEYPEVKAGATAINQILVERKLEVRDLAQQIANFDRIRSKMTNFQGDANAFIAASFGADIYFEYSIEVIREGSGKKARVDINVKEAATAKLLGAGSGQSETFVTSDISSLCQIAVNNCIDRVMEQVRGYWSDIPTNGKPVIITFSASDVELNKLAVNGKKFDRELTNAMKILTISYRREVSTAKSMQFNPVYIDAFKYDDIESFSYALQDFLDIFGLNYNAEIEGKSIEIAINK